jgi:acyl carrier protein
LLDADAAKLESCFLQVFPDLKQSDVATASHATVSAWDSIAQVTLLSLIGEEFNLDIDFEEFEGATSFNDILTLVRQKQQNA